MDFLIFTVFVIAFFVLVFLGGAGIFLFTSRLFKVAISYKKAFLAVVIANFLSILIGIILFFFDLLPMIAPLFLFLVQFAVYYFLLHKYYEVSLLKSLGIYVLFFVAWYVACIALVVPIRMYVVGPFLVSGEAMNPTYPNGEYLFINKFKKDFERGDVIVFRYPKNPEYSLIKRIVGLPEEKIEIQNGSVFINGQVLSEPYYSGQTVGDTSMTLASDEYFVMGDNRAESSDSRVWGVLKKNLIHGKVWLDVTNLASRQ